MYFYQEYLQACQYSLDDDLEEGRRLRKKKAELDYIKAIHQIHMSTVRIADKYIVSEKCHELIDQKMKELDENSKAAGNQVPEPDLKWLLPAFPDQPQFVWLEEEELGYEDLPFEIKGFIFHAYQDEKAAKAILDQLTPDLQDFFSKPRPDPIMWIVEIVSTEKHVCFKFSYNGDDWCMLPEFHICPWDACATRARTSQKVCHKCDVLLQTMAIYLTLALAAARGDFQQEEIEIVEERRPEQKPIQIQQKTSTEDRDVIVKRINVASRKKYVYQDQDKKQESQAEGQRQNWLTTHTPEEIEVIKKSAKEHKRHYRDGKEVDVKASKPRPYRRLKVERVTRLDA